MRILHTADWHLGASLGPFSRIEEQKLFLEQLCHIVQDENVDMVLVAGDIFDTANPSAAAEGLFYEAMTNLAAFKIPIVLVAGNHDSAERLSAPSPAISKLGILVFATPNTVLPARQHDGFSVEPLGPGCAEIIIGNQQAVIAAVPFVSEHRLGEVIFAAKDEAGMQRDYSAKVGELFAHRAQYFRQNTINIATGHFHITGGDVSRGLERDIQIGGVFAVQPEAIPAVDYIAMGHLHRAQKVKCGPDGTHLAYYAGSPLPYSLSEQSPKSVYIADLAPGQAPIVEKILLNCPKPLELWEVETAAQAVEKCRQPSNAYKYIRITGETTINPYDIKEMRRLAADIVSIDLAEGKEAAASEFDAFAAIDPRREFVNFYAKTKGVQPAAQLLSIFEEILASEERS
ncbi:MAG: exonuclease subunit SbcD [Defluviitaleaceae bacterium]|nr:exonuclease subunit SbcD [Defluviitaleaceae bacterium]